MGEVVSAATDSGAVFYVELADRGGPSNVSLNGVLSFAGVRETVEGIAGEVVQAWQKVKPDEASVEFALALKVKEGRLTGLLVSGGAEASLKVTLTWKGGKISPAADLGSETDSEPEL